MVLSGVGADRCIAGLIVLSAWLRLASLDICVAELLVLFVTEVTGGTAGLIVLSNSLKLASVDLCVVEHEESDHCADASDRKAMELGISLF